MIVIGVDPHKQTHTAAAVEAALGELVGERTVQARRAGQERLLVWARELGQERLWALEDCRHVSVSLERFLLASGERVVSQSEYHQSFWGEAQPRGGRMLTPALAINHTDEELEFLAGLVNQQTAWQIAGRRGVKDGSGYMDPKPGQVHPLTPR